MPSIQYNALPVCLERRKDVWWPYRFYTCMLECDVFHELRSNHEAGHHYSHNYPLMSPNELSSQTTLEGHTAAVTVMEFSADGRFLATAADNGVILIFSTSSWTPVSQFLDVSPVSALAWHEKKCYLLFCGHQSGDLHILTMSKSMVRPHHLAYIRARLQ